MNYVRVPFRHKAHGRGLGGILSSLRHMVKPILSKSKDIFLKPLAKEGVNLFANTAKDILQGQKPSESLKKNFAKSKKKVVRRGKKALMNKVVGKNKNKTKSTAKGGGKKTKTKRKGTKKKSKKRVTKKKSIFDDFA